MSTLQYLRKVTLLLLTGPLDEEPAAYMVGPDNTQNGLDLSEFHFKFQTAQQDVESPNNCTIRVYNLSASTVRQIRGEFSRVVLQAGYEGQFGVIFDGTIKQFRIGKENATDSYLDILAADGDLAYNFGVINRSLGPAANSAERIRKIWEDLTPYGVKPGKSMDYTGGVLPRGKVLFGMARTLMRNEAQAMGATWNISNGRINITPLDGYLPGEAIVVNAANGMVGIPEATTEGVEFKMLLNPRLQVGGRCQIDNDSINKTLQQNPTAAPVAFNRYTGLQFFASTTDDGFYRILVVEHTGDTRGPDWHSKVVALALDPATQKVKPYG